jgi:hypothetical protein
MQIIRLAKLSRTILIISFFTLINHLVFAQGCSDAGFCTMGAMKPNQHFSNKVNFRLKSVEAGQFVGITKFGDVIVTYLADLSLAINSKTAVQVKLPYTFTSGFLGSTNGMGDISLSATRNILYRENYQVNFTAGSKIPTNNSDKRSSDGRPLPMYYQTSLGTFDAIFGVSFVTKKWLVATGYQQALNPNGNTFFWGPWAGTEFQERVKDYPTSIDLERGKDIMFRVERNFRSSRFNTYIGLLPIYRITNDKRTNPKTKLTEEVKGTSGLALTALYGFGYRFSVKSSFKFLLGAVLVRREVHLDGLSREVVNSFSYEYRF